MSKLWLDARPQNTGRRNLLSEMWLRESKTFNLQVSVHSDHTLGLLVSLPFIAWEARKEVKRRVRAERDDYEKTRGSVAQRKEKVTHNIPAADDGGCNFLNF